MTDHVLELRQYTLHPGQRDVLIDLFERLFVAGQEEAGMGIPGHFRDWDDPDRFVWLRTFPDMESRKDMLHAFYYGPVWQAHRNEANATMIDSDNVLLLEPATPGSPPPGRSTVEISVYERSKAPSLTAGGTGYVTKHAENTFPALPVREGEDVYVWFAQRLGQAPDEGLISRVRVY
ncbi:NIPSNAP family protein [Longispora albida]|uniref:NIPSNAP family protein n=1 Tax=Longispora albida TaxID=203523 RepID=UPI000379388F|nr:NIPSNAP family protein [Longispora albida]